MFLGSLKGFSFDAHNLKNKIRSKRELPNNNYGSSHGEKVISSSSVESSRQHFHLLNNRGKKKFDSKLFSLSADCR